MTTISTQLPPMFERVKQTFNLEGTKPIFAYKHVIYNPFDGLIDEFMIAHEEVHFAQQDKIGADLWWDKYLMDVTFRLEQEIPAYKAQYARAKKRFGYNNGTFRYLQALATDLSGPLYGNLITKSEAIKLIEK